MNFDNLKDAWAQEPDNTGAIPLSLSGSTTSAIRRLRKNMRAEFFWTMGGLGATLAFLLIWKRTSILTFYAAFFLFLQAGYYFTRFFLFYRRTASYDIGLRKSLRKFAYELELNMEIYKTYSFCVTPVACLLWLALLDSATGLVHPYFSASLPTSTRTLVWLLGTLLCTPLFTMFCLRFHLWTQYGRYLKELKGVLDDLEE